MFRTRYEHHTHISMHRHRRYWFGLWVWSQGGGSSLPRTNSFIQGWVYCRVLSRHDTSWGPPRVTCVRGNIRHIAAGLERDGVGRVEFWQRVAYHQIDNGSWMWEGSWSAHDPSHQCLLCHLLHIGIWRGYIHPMADSWYCHTSSLDSSSVQESRPTSSQQFKMIGNGHNILLCMCQVFSPYFSGWREYGIRVPGMVWCIYCWTASQPGSPKMHGHSLYRRHLPSAWV